MNIYAQRSLFLEQVTNVVFPFLIFKFSLPLRFDIRVSVCGCELILAVNVYPVIVCPAYLSGPLYVLGVHIMGTIHPLYRGKDVDFRG